MFVSDRIVFVELHKTGCSHIGKLLDGLIEGHHEGKHNPAPAELQDNAHLFLGSVRNPWDWYLSLWAYGCDHRGAVYHRVTRQWDGQARDWRHQPLQAAVKSLRGLSKRARRWQQSYADVDDPAHFREWLYMMHDPTYWRDLGEHYDETPVNQLAGFLSYRYLRLFCRPGQEQAIGSIDQLEDYEHSHCYIDHFIRNEHLEDDLVQALERCGLTLSDAQRQAIYGAGKTNTSSRRRPTADYYDKDSMTLVAEREKLIIDRFGYELPTLH